MISSLQGWKKPALIIWCDLLCNASQRTSPEPHPSNPSISPVTYI